MRLAWISSAKPMQQPIQLSAHWFNGRSSRPRNVHVLLTPGPRGPTLHLRPLDPADGPERMFAHRDVEWPAAWSARRHPKVLSVELRDAGSLRIDDPTAWHAAMQCCGGQASLADRMQTRWPIFLVVLVAGMIALIAFYRYGTPWAATQLTRFVPQSWESALDARVMAQIDGAHSPLKPSKLTAQRQAVLSARFDSLLAQLQPRLLRYRDHRPQYRLYFRRGIGANAFALPGGTVVMTDALVELADGKSLGDDALIGVLAHEIGHVVHRHGTRLIVEQGVLQIGLGLAMGDVSSIVSAGSTLLTTLAYRRTHEQEADCFSLALMRQAQLPTAPMGQLLLAISDEHADRRDHQAGADEQPHLFEQLLSSHPDTKGRAQRLVAGDPGRCER